MFSLITKHKIVLYQSINEFEKYHVLTSFPLFRPLTLGRVNEFGIFEPFSEPDPDSDHTISTGEGPHCLYSES